MTTLSHDQKFNLQFWQAVPMVTHIPVAYGTTNLGDDIQSCVASDRLQCSRYVDRDRPQNWPRDAVVPLIGWFGYGQFPAKAQCILVGFHIQSGSRSQAASRSVVDWFKAGVKYQGFPAMARDIVTRDFLRSLGIDSEFGGCVTQTLEKRHHQRLGTLVVDVADTNIVGCRDTHERHHLPSLSPEQRVAEARVQLERFAHSKLVHTTRFHVLLPCLAMGTEVVFHRKPGLFQPERFSGHLSLEATVSPSL